MLRRKSNKLTKDKSLVLISMPKIRNREKRRVLATPHEYIVSNKVNITSFSLYMNIFVLLTSEKSPENSDGQAPCNRKMGFF